MDAKNITNTNKIHSIKNHFKVFMKFHLIFKGFLKKNSLEIFLSIFFYLSLRKYNASYVPLEIKFCNELIFFCMSGKHVYAYFVKQLFSCMNAICR